MDRALGHVLWIGGPPCAGKTSVALLLAGRHGLRAYNSDLHTWEHHDEAVARGYQDATFWQSATPDQAWLAEFDSIVEHTLAANAERCELMLEDLQGLPDSPLIVAEGTPLFPWLIADRIADPCHAVWLVPTADFQRARLAERSTIGFQRTSDPARALENRIRREIAVGELIARDAGPRSLHVIRIDGSQDIPQVAGRVEEIFRQAIEDGPRATTVDERRELRRRHNRQIHRQVSSYFERVPGAGDAEQTPIPFGCECGANRCLGELRVTLAEAEEAFAAANGSLLAAGHSR